MKTLRFTLAICFLTCFTFSLFAQKSKNNDNGQSVTLVVYGTADNENEAIKNALRSAIEQTFGTFVSANTQILNDDLVKDEIVSVASGNIEKYSLISSEKDSDGRTSVSVRATVSIGKLVQFAQSKGASTELAGAAFAMNMKMRKLNKENERQALCHTLDELLKISELNLFNFELKTDEPKIAYDSEYFVTTTIVITPNENYNNLVKILKSTLVSLSISTKEQEEYRQSNDQFFEYSHEKVYSPYGQIGVERFLRSIFDFEKFAFVLRNSLDTYEIMTKLRKLETNIWKSAMSFEIRDNLKNTAKPICVNLKVTNMGWYRDYNFNIGSYIPIFAVESKASERDSNGHYISYYDIYGLTSTSESGAHFLGRTFTNCFFVESTFGVGKYGDYGSRECSINACDLFGTPPRRKPVLGLSGFSFAFPILIYYNEKDILNLSSITVSPISQSEFFTKRFTIRQSSENNNNREELF